MRRCMGALVRWCGGAVVHWCGGGGAVVVVRWCVVRAGRVARSAGWQHAREAGALSLQRDGERHVVKRVHGGTLVRVSVRVRLGLG